MKPSKTIKIAFLFFALAVSVLNGFAQLEHKKAVTGQNQVLPVSLISFNLKSEKQNEIIATWSTAAETNNSHFTLYIAPKDSQNFMMVGKVNSAGDSLSQKDYQFVINNVIPRTVNGLPFLLILLIPSVRGRILRLAIFSSFAIIAISCSKRELATITELKTFYVKLEQVDYDGKITVLYTRPITVEVPKP